MKYSLPRLLLVSILGLSACSKGMKEFKTLKSGLKYKIVDDKKGEKKAVVGSVITMHITTLVGDSVLFDSRKINNDKAIEAPVNEATQPGDIMEAFPLLTEGDSVIMQMASDSLFKDPQNRPPFIKPGAVIEFRVKLVSVQTKEEFEKSKKEASKVQAEADDKAIQEYIKKNNLQATKTASGLYYAITQPGSGANASNGQLVSMMYTGTLLDGTKFDSNEDPAFEHTEPFEFTLGMGMVIRGWDEGIALLNKGSKAVFIVPSPLAYGERAMPGNPKNPKGIPANSPLIFNVEVKDIKEAKPTK
ncbi:MAG: FKBP-type peptidyl-prolyl cis-trans isomerase [Chitinophagaceae bacterium]|nr:FKBP-type peptidyl-prolyl cis-trans isomerase [Chitinophagaceae bacterium]